MAMPWACFIATLLGIPAGTVTGRQGAMMAILSAIGCFFAFYALVHVGIFLGKREVVAPWLGAWLPDIAFAAAGAWWVATMRR
jgi:lipopolysaccharide export system permease protein